MTSADRAVEIHDEQAELFRRRYEEMEVAPPSNSFAFSRAKLQRHIDDLFRSLPSGASLGDIGCGVGLQAAQASSAGLRAVGCDPSWQMLTSAVRGAPPRAQAVGSALPFRTESLDAALLIEVIRYLPDPGPTLDEVHRVLRPGGVALITFAPKWSLNGYALVNRVTSRRQVGTLSRVPQYFHTVREAGEVVQASGFAAESVRACYFGPFALLSRVAPRVESALLRRWNPIDDWLSEREQIRNLANMLVVSARKPS